MQAEVQLCRCAPSVAHIDKPRTAEDTGTGLGLWGKALCRLGLTLSRARRRPCWVRLLQSLFATLIASIRLLGRCEGHSDCHSGSGPQAVWADHPKTSEVYRRVGSNIGSCGLLPWRRARHWLLAATEDHDDAHLATTAGARLAQNERGYLGLQLLFIGSLGSLGTAQNSDLCDVRFGRHTGQRAIMLEGQVRPASRTADCRQIQASRLALHRFGRAKRGGGQLEDVSHRPFD